MARRHVRRDAPVNSPPFASLRRAPSCSSPPRVLRPATLSYIFVVRAPFLFALAPTKYEGRFAGVLRVKTRYRIGGASATAVTSLLYRFRVPLSRHPSRTYPADVVEGLSPERVYLTRAESFLAYCACSRDSPYMEIIDEAYV